MQITRDILNAAGRVDEDSDPLASAVAWVFSRIVDEIATVEDLKTFRAWIIRQRLTGTSEEDLHTSTLVADDLARKLGVA